VWRHETDDVAPVPEENLAATVPCCNHVVRAVVELLLTAARPKEIRLLRPRDVNTQGRVEVAKGYWVQLGAGVWAVRLKRHKTAAKKVRRVILFGPRARAILRPFLERPPDAYLFAPAEAIVKRDADRRAARESKAQPSQICRKRPGARRKPGDHYSRTAFAVAAAV